MKYPTTLEEFGKLTPQVQGHLWPLCKNCHHIAQQHNSHVSDPQELSCGLPGLGQCKTCGQWTPSAPCSCRGYDGPKDVAELLVWLAERAERTNALADKAIVDAKARIRALGGHSAS